MKLFFQFLWMGMSKLLLYLLAICILLTALAIPVLTAITFTFILKKIMHIILAILLSIVIAIICYCIEYIIYHSLNAVMYCRENHTDSLKTAWEKTAIDWNTWL